MKRLFILIAILIPLTCFAASQQLLLGVLARINAGGTPTSVNVIPDTDGDSYNEWTGKDAGTKWSEVDDPVGSPDDDTSYMETVDTNKAQGFDTYPAITAISITSVTIHFRCKEIGGNAFAKAKLRVSGTVYLGDAKTLTVSYDDFSQIWTENPNTSSAWTEAEIEGGDALQEWIIESAGLDAGETCRCTQVYMVVHYVQ
ncbi:hypothetical protein KA005_72365 [bacterium]|nr:hypothetical protein [bacterium]